MIDTGSVFSVFNFSEKSHDQLCLGYPVSGAGEAQCGVYWLSFRTYLRFQSLTNEIVTNVFIAILQRRIRVLDVVQTSVNTSSLRNAFSSNTLELFKLIM